MTMRAFVHAALRERGLSVMEKSPMVLMVFIILEWLRDGSNSCVGPTRP